jgi:hypothetical protein
MSPKSKKFSDPCPRCNEPDCFDGIRPGSIAGQMRSKADGGGRWPKGTLCPLHAEAVELQKARF